MTQGISANLLKTIFLRETDEALLPLIRLSHASWVDDIRLVANATDVTHQGEVFTAHAFDLQLPDQDPDTLPVLQWQADAVDQELVQKFRDVGTVVTAEVFTVFASAPDVIEVGPYQVEMTSAEYDGLKIGGPLSIEPILDEPFVKDQLTPQNAPGLF